MKVYYSDGTTSYGYKFEVGKTIHRDDGPAIERDNGDKYWYDNGDRHRIDGPAIEYGDGNIVYYYSDREVTEEYYWNSIMPALLEQEIEEELSYG
jgi:hypothetical protein